MEGEEEGGPVNVIAMKFRKGSFIFPNEMFVKLRNKYLHSCKWNLFPYGIFPKAPGPRTFLKGGGIKGVEEKGVRRNTISEIALVYKGKCRRNF